MSKLTPNMEGAYYNGKPVHIQAIKPRGWIQIIDYHGSAKNVRATDIKVQATSVAAPPAAVTADIMGAMERSLPAPQVPESSSTIVKENPPTMATARTSARKNGDTGARTIVGAKFDPNKYERVKGKTRTTFDVGDEVAVKLRNMELPDIYEFAAKKLDVSVRSLQDKYRNLNAGQQRMNLGNRIRGAARAKERAKTAS